MNLSLNEERILHIIGMSSKDPGHHDHVRRLFIPVLKTKTARLIALHLIGAPAEEVRALEKEFTPGELVEADRLLTHTNQNIKSHKEENEARDNQFKGTLPNSHSIAA